MSMEQEPCPDCGNTNMVEIVEEQSFQYGYKNPVILRAVFPVFSCRSCGMEMFDYRGEELRQKAVDDYLKSVA